MSKKVLIIYAHPEPSSLTRQLVDVSVECLTAQGHEVLQSDLYAMGWKAIFDEHDFLSGPTLSGFRSEQSPPTPIVIAAKALTWRRSKTRF